MSRQRLSDPRRVLRRRTRKRPRTGPKEWLARPPLDGPDSLRATFLMHLEALTVRHFSPATVEGKARSFVFFVAWCEARAVTTPAQVTRAMLERYQRHLFYLRKANGHPLSVRAQVLRLVNVCGYFRWLCQQNLLPANPASGLQLPRADVRLPQHALTVREVEATLSAPNFTTLAGLRDRAMLEVLWATGLRRVELVHLKVWDVSAERGTVFVRQGKGRRDRVVPVGARALEWVRRYVEEARPRHAAAVDDGTLFLSDAGEALELDTLSVLVRQHLTAAGVKAKGSCHLFRHACATAMLEGGADIRFVQELLGHAKLETTQVYTHVAISKLKAVYASAHPAGSATLGDEVAVSTAGEAAAAAEEDVAAQRQAVLDAVAAEADEDEG